MTDITIEDGALLLRDTAKPIDQGGLIRLRPITGNTSMQGKPGGGFIVEMNLSANGSFTQLRRLQHMLGNWNPDDATQGTYPNQGLPYKNDADFYLWAQNVGITSDNNLRQVNGQGASSALDVGPVVTLGRDQDAPAGSYLAGVYFGGRAAGSDFINVAYAAIVARVESNDPADPYGSLVICTAGPPEQNAGNYPRFYFCRGLAAQGLPDLGDSSTNVVLSNANVFTTAEQMAPGESPAVAGDVIGIRYDGLLTRNYDLCGAFGLVYRPGTPTLLAAAGKAPCNINVDVGQYIRAYRKADGTVGQTATGSPTDTNIIGRVREYYTSTACIVAIGAR